MIYLFFAPKDLLLGFVIVLFFGGPLFLLFGAGSLELLGRGAGKDWPPPLLMGKT